MVEKEKEEGARSECGWEGPQLEMGQVGKILREERAEGEDWRTVKDA